jgi:hypothetical protein
MRYQVAEKRGACRWYVCSGAYDPRVFGPGVIRQFKTEDDAKAAMLRYSKLMRVPLEKLKVITEADKW